MFLQFGGPLQVYSVQQLVSCSAKNTGCGGGAPWEALLYIEDYPLVLDSDYPYIASYGWCTYDHTKGVGKVKFMHQITKGSES